MSDGAAAASTGGQAAAIAGTPASTTISSVSGVATTTGGTSTGSTTQTGDWTSGFNDDLKGYVQTKGFKDPATAVDAYRNFEKLMGVPKERLLKLPEKADAPEWKDVYERLGKPKAAIEYALKGDDKDQIEWAQNTFHELNLSRTQADTLLNKWNERISGQVKAQQESLKLKAVEEDVGLKKEWGMAYEQNIALGKKAVQAFKFAPEVIDKLESSMGYAGVMKFMQTLGEKIGEHGFVNGADNNGSFNGALSPEQARNKINSLKGDTDFVRRYVAGDSTAREEMERLHNYAYPG